jgi:hypothetical protein
MKRLGILALGALIGVFGFMYAFAQDDALSAEASAATAETTGDVIAAVADETPAEPAANAYGFNLDDIAVNQGVVAYWYAHGFANAFGSLPAKWADLEARKLPLRKFESPHTGEAINFDDGTLDFDGDMTYSSTGCDAQIQVQTTAGVVTLPGMLQSTWNCPQRCNPCNPCGSCASRCPKYCDVSICGWDNWGCMCPDEAVCKIIQWMMWKSFETYECRYGCRPADEMMWYASGFAPVDKNWKELAPQMYIEFIYHKCSLIKAKVHCCSPCKTKCGSPCQSKCNSCSQQSCGNCGKPSCNSCKSKCSKPSCGSCGKSDCGGKCKSKCGKPKCGSCGKSDCSGNCGRSNSDKCKPSGGCDRCGGGGCNKCHG